MSKHQVRKAIFLHVPVIHQGFLDLLHQLDESVEIYLFSNEVLRILSGKPDIASIDPAEMQQLLQNMGWQVSVLLKSQLDDEQQREQLLSRFEQIVLVNDEIGRSFADKFLTKFENEIKFNSVFLRWDRSQVFSQKEFSCEQGRSKFDIEMMKKAYQISERSGDWWRQVGAVAVKNNKVVLEGWNRALPDEHEAYRHGAIRDLMEVGEKPEFSHYIHAEQSIISQAAKKGISLAGASLYVTHFPCPVCAKLIVESGFDSCFFAEGSSSLQGDQLISKSGVRLIQVMLE